jgi:hypothetical protein|nr:hypothetical protein [Actinophrys sol]
MYIEKDKIEYIYFDFNQNQNENFNMNLPFIPKKVIKYLDNDPSTKNVPNDVDEIFVNANQIDILFPYVDFPIKTKYPESLLHKKLLYIRNKNFRRRMLEVNIDRFSELTFINPFEISNSVFIQNIKLKKVQKVFMLKLNYLLLFSYFQVDDILYYFFKSNEFVYSLLELSKLMVFNNQVLDKDDNKIYFNNNRIFIDNFIHDNIFPNEVFENTSNFNNLYFHFCIENSSFVSIFSNIVENKLGEN